MPRGVGTLRLGWEGGTTGPQLGSGPEVQRPGLLVTRGLPQGGPPSTFRPCDIYSSILQTGAAETVTPSPGPYGAPGGTAPTSWWPPVRPHQQASPVSGAPPRTFCSLGPHRGTCHSQPWTPSLSGSPQSSSLGSSSSAMEQRRGAWQHPESLGGKRCHVLSADLWKGEECNSMIGFNERFATIRLRSIIDLGLFQAGVLRGQLGGWLAPVGLGALGAAVPLPILVHKVGCDLAAALATALSLAWEGRRWPAPLDALPGPGLPPQAQPSGPASCPVQPPRGPALPHSPTPPSCSLPFLCVLRSDPGTSSSFPVSPAYPLSCQVKSNPCSSSRPRLPQAACVCTLLPAAPGCRPGLWRFREEEGARPRPSLLESVAVGRGGRTFASPEAPWPGPGGLRGDEGAWGRARCWAHVAGPRAPTAGHVAARRPVFAALT